jgi:putative heme-binding domain-containing protein
VAEILELKGDAARGRVAASRCLTRHRIEGNGPDYGPDLKGWGLTQTREVIVRSIVDPSAEIALGYKGTEVLLKDGGVIHGIAFNNSDSYIKNSPPIVIQSAGGITQFIPQNRIKKKHEFKRSLMYDPVTLQLKAQDIADIAAWLQTCR